MKKLLFIFLIIISCKPDVKKAPDNKPNTEQKAPDNKPDKGDEIKGQPTEVWVNKVVKQHNRSASPQAQIKTVEQNPFTLDFNKGGWSIGHGFYNVTGDRDQSGNFKAILYNKDIELLGHNIEINNAMFMLDAKIYDNGVLQNVDVLLRQGRIKLANNLSYFEQK